MREGPDIAGPAALIGDPARAAMLAALMSAPALSAGELAREAGVAASTASGHLAQLVAARLLIVETQGRARYYRLAGAHVAEAIEALLGLGSGLGLKRARPGPRDPALRRARVCYDHLAGELGVELYARLIAQGALAASARGLAPTPQGGARFRAEGVDLDALERGKRPLCRDCLDWSERRPHLAGALGAAMLSIFEQRGWLRRGNGRALALAPLARERVAGFAAPRP